MTPAFIAAWQELERIVDKAFYGGKGEMRLRRIRPKFMRSYAAFNFKDANHKTIASELRRRGVDVVDLMQPLDMLARYRSFVGFIEAKVPGSRAKWTRPQLQFIADTRFPVCVAKDAESAWLFMDEGEGLITREQKDKLAGFLIRNSGKFFTPKEIEEVLAA